MKEINIFCLALNHNGEDIILPQYGYSDVPEMFEDFKKYKDFPKNIHIIPISIPKFKKICSDLEYPMFVRT